MSYEEAVRRAEALIRSLAPARQGVGFRVPLEADESHWFNAAVGNGVVSFSECPRECFRVKKWGVPGPDHFVTPAGKPRHLFSKPVGEVGWLNREYVPHIAAYAYVILEKGYDPTPPATPARGPLAPWCGAHRGVGAGERVVVRGRRDRQAQR